MPLSIIKKGIIKFSPEFPVEKVKALEKMDMLTGGKVFVQLNSSLRNDVSGFYCDGLFKIWSCPRRPIGK